MGDTDSNSGDDTGDGDCKRTNCFVITQLKIKGRFSLSGFNRIKRFAVSAFVMFSC